jgi:hypothetical protein
MQGMPVRGVDHIHLAVSDVEGSLAFYLGVLGPLDASKAERAIGTPTLRTDHNALNLARDLPPDPSECRRNAHLTRAAGRSGPGGRGVCCQCVVTDELPDRVMLVACESSSVARYGPSSSATTFSSEGQGGASKTSDSKLSVPIGWALI